MRSSNLKCVADMATYIEYELENGGTLLVEVKDADGSMHKVRPATGWGRIKMSYGTATGSCTLMAAATASMARSIGSYLVKNR
jgi:hypothetical protein